MRIGPYEVLQELARGGMGVVYRARDVQLGRDVALKVVLNAGEAQRRRFAREGRVLAELEHPHVVPVFETGAADGRPWLAMQLLDGDSLEDRLKRGGPLEPQAAAELVAALADAVQACHDRGVLHRDLKPANVLFDGDRPLLADFGLVKELERSGETQALTQQGALLGTPGYWAPEQVKGDPSAIGVGADVYGLGAILYAALTGRPPIPVGSLVECVVATEQRRPDPPGTPLDAVCMRCLEKRPEDRYPSAAAVAAALRRDPVSGARRLGLAGAVVAVALTAVAVAALRPEPPSEPERSASAPTLTPTEEATPDPTPVPAAVGPRPSVAQTHYERGNVHYNRRAYREAIQQYTLALARDPQHVGSLLNRGICRALLQDRRGALADLTEAVRLRPDSKAFYNRGWARKRFGDLRGALRDLDRVIQLQPTLQRAYGERASIKVTQRDLRGALADFNEAIRLGPPTAPLFHNRGDMKFKLRDYDGAIADFTAAIRQDERFYESYRYRGLVKAAKGLNAEAIADYTRSLELMARDPSTLTNRGNIYSLLGKHGSAIADFTRALELDPKLSAAYYNRGNSRRALGEHAAAAADFKLGLALQPATAARYEFDVRAYVAKYAPD